MSNMDWFMRQLERKKAASREDEAEQAAKRIVARLRGRTVRVMKEPPVSGALWSARFPGGSISVFPDYRAARGGRKWELPTEEDGNAVAALSIQAVRGSVMVADGGDEKLYVAAVGPNRFGIALTVDS